MNVRTTKHIRSRVLQCTVTPFNFHLYKAHCSSIYFQAWTLYEKDKPTHLVDESLEGDLDADEARRYVKIGLLCTQDIPKNRPTMSVIAKMLRGEIDVDEEEISKPGLLKELMNMKNSSNGPRASSSGDKSSSSESTNMTHATMTFTSILDRSN